MTSQGDRDRDEQVSWLKEEFAVSTRLTILERDLAAANAATVTAFASKQKHDDEHNQILDALKEALSNCLTEPEYTRRHEQLEHRIADMERTMWKMIGGLVALWCVIQVATHFAK